MNAPTLPEGARPTNAMDAARPDVAVCPNLRRPEEAQITRDRGGIVWRVNRLNADGSQFISTTRDPNHELETGLDRWCADRYLTNTTGQASYFVHVIRSTFDYDLAVSGKGTIFRTRCSHE